MLSYGTSGTVIWASPHYSVNSGEWGEDTTGEDARETEVPGGVPEYDDA